MKFITYVDYFPGHFQGILQGTYIGYEAVAWEWMNDRNWVFLFLKPQNVLTLSDAIAVIYISGDYEIFILMPQVLLKSIYQSERILILKRIWGVLIS